MVEHFLTKFQVCSVKFDRDSHAFAFFLLDCILYCTYASKKEFLAKFQKTESSALVVHLQTEMIDGPELPSQLFSPLPCRARSLYAKQGGSKADFVLGGNIQPRQEFQSCNLQ